LGEEMALWAISSPKNLKIVSFIPFQMPFPHKLLSHQKPKSRKIRRFSAKPGGIMIYIVEDDTNIRQMESYALKNSGFDVAEFGSGAPFLDALAARLPRLIILDVMLPGPMDGLALLTRLRADARTCAVPVIMVSAKSHELDAVRGLDTGADDYITKPFGILEFISRVKAVLRRMDPPEAPAVTCALGPIRMDNGARRVEVDGRVCELTFKEYELLRLLLEYPGLVLGRDRIMDKVWDTDFEGESRTVDMHIKALRQKLGKAGAMIKTVRNVGYKIEL